MHSLSPNLGPLLRFLLHTVLFLRLPLCPLQGRYFPSKTFHHPIICNPVVPSVQFTVATCSNVIEVLSCLPPIQLPVATHCSPLEVRPRLLIRLFPALDTIRPSN
jgi:hypothetical protein